MTRLNFTLIWCVGFISLLCYQRVDRYGYGRYFHEALETIHGEALQPIDRQPLFDAGVRGMTALLDQHSVFIPRNKRQGYENDLDQHFSGVGIEVRYDPEKKQIFVANTIIGQIHPAHDAGMRRGDQILAVNGQSVAGMPLDDAMKMIKGKAGQTVQVRVLHAGETKPVDLQIVRRDIQVDSVVGDVRRDDGSWSYMLDTKPPIAYVRIKSFSEGTAQQLREVLDRLQNEGKLQGLVVDVRDDLGGYLHSAIAVCDMFIKSGVIVSTRNRKDELTGDQENEVIRASGQAPFSSVPMVVLINGESASASEIFAACMQDHGRAIVIGSRSFGKGSVQKMFQLETDHSIFKHPEHSILKLTTASYWRPSGKNIHRLSDKVPESAEWGVSPDAAYNLPLDKEQEKKRREARQDRDGFRPGAAAEPAPPLDPQLAKAVGYLEGELRKAKP